MSNADSPHCRTRSGNPACGAPVRTQHAGDAHPQGTRALVASPVQEPLVVQSLVVELCPCSRYRSRSPKKRGVQARGTRLTTQSRGSEPFDLPVPARARRRMHRHRSADEPTSAPAVRHHERLPSTTLFNDTDRILRLRRSGRGVAAAAPPRVSQSRRHLLTVCGESAHGRRHLSTRVDPPPQPYVRSLPKPKRSG